MASVYLRSSAILFCLCCLGCGEPGVPREAVHGAVTLDDVPLEKGSILFTPLGDGPSAGGEIENGRYELPRHLGPSPGKYRVEINAWRSSGKSIHDEATGQNEDALISIIPPHYNRNSELEIDVQVGGENAFDFSLKSK